MPPTRSHTLRPDPRGDYRPEIGRKPDGKQARFNLGKNLPLAEVSRDRIQAVYLDACRIREAYRQPPSWTDAAFHAAKVISEGRTHVPLPLPSQIVEVALLPSASMFMVNIPPTLDPEAASTLHGYDARWWPPYWADESQLPPEAWLWAHRAASRLYPSVHWDIPAVDVRQQVFAAGQRQLVQQAELQGKLIDKPTVRAITGTLHEAWTAYRKYLDETEAKRVGAGQLANRHKQLKAFLATHHDEPLATLDVAACQKLVDHWRFRPVSEKTGERISEQTATHRLSEFSMFVKWLHKSGGYGWRKPEDFDSLDWSIVKDQRNRSIKQHIGKAVFSVEQLAEINRHCGTLERALLLLGLNCAFGASESGQLELEDLYLRQKNPLEHVWKPTGYTSDPSESWIAFRRPKTGVAGCWLLWPETVASLETWLAVRPKSESKRVVLTGIGTPLYAEQTANAQKNFYKLWERLWKRINNDEIKLPFGTLRDQFSEWATQQGESELASIALAHGSPFKDDILTSYANLPFPRLFELQRRYREFLKPAFEAAK